MRGRDTRAGPGRSIQKNRMGRQCRLVLPQSVRKIGASAFASCEQLKNVQLNECVEKLEEVINGETYEGSVLPFVGYKQFGSRPH